jgi:hypothetical protein
VLTADQRANYEKTRQTALSELEDLEREIAAEVARVKRRLLELQEDKKAVKLIVDGVSARLGISSVPPLKEINLSDLSRPDLSEEASSPTPFVQRTPVTEPASSR